jgi:type III restriction enzyme
MKFTLKGEYQDDAVAESLTNLAKARRRWHEENELNAFSLTATTGAGKTVMAAAVFEALFHGDDNFGFEADPGAVVLWFSDDPSLNEQTRFRLLEASDRLGISDLVVVESTFNRDRFKPGKVYFLNTQKLSKNSRLVRGGDSETPETGTESRMFDMRPDGRHHTIWDTIQNTIEDPQLTLYLVLDEAHRGMGTPTRSSQEERGTIVMRLINGGSFAPPIPIVWGISATVERFNDAMKDAKGRGNLPNIQVDSAKVQASGLLKDDIVLDIPKEAGSFDTVLLRRATDKLKKSTESWKQYASEQNQTQVVTPLMVWQVPNTPEPKEVGRALDVIFDRWSDIGIDQVAHVFGDHTAQEFGSYRVPYISPEQVQDATWVRVLIAKDAISTGWDCPRAEVMVSFRRAKDRTHITQLLGRMVRTPLARRIPGNEVLNAVDCVLPFFDKNTTKNIVDALMTGSDGGKGDLPGRRVLIDPVEMLPNGAIPEEVWDKFLLLPSQSLPRKSAKPVKRLTALAQELAFDHLLAGAGKEAHRKLHLTLDAARAKYVDEIETATNVVLKVEGQTLTASLRLGTKTFTDFVEEADTAAIEDAYSRAGRLFSADLARTYAEHVAKSEKADSEEDALLDAHARVAAMGMVPEMKEYLEEEAATLAAKWFEQYRVSIKALADDRQEVYRQLKEMSVEPQVVDLVKPKNRLEPTRVRQASGDEEPLPMRQGHLLADSDGNFPVDLNDWERDVLDKEMARKGFVAWYRNPPRVNQDSLAITYRVGSGYKSMRPDFIFLVRNADGSIDASLVDPHGHHLGDALPKLRGLAEYAVQYGSHYQRIEAVAKVDDKLRVLDLKVTSVRDAVAAAKDAKALYCGPASNGY